jgi:hypothetical protein
MPFGPPGAGQSIPVTAGSGSPALSARAFRAAAGPVASAAVVQVPVAGPTTPPASKSIAAAAAVPSGPTGRAARVSVSVATSPTAHRPGVFTG